VNKKTTLNIFLAKFRKYFKIIFSEFSGVSCGPQSQGSNGPSGSLMSHSFRGPRGSNGTRGSCVFRFFRGSRGSKGTLGSKGLFGVIFFF